MATTDVMSVVILTVSSPEAPRISVFHPKDEGVVPCASPANVELEMSTGQEGGELLCVTVATPLLELVSVGLPRPALSVAWAEPSVFWRPALEGRVTVSEVWAPVTVLRCLVVWETSLRVGSEAFVKTFVPFPSGCRV